MGLGSPNSSTAPVGAERRIHWRGLHYAIVAAGDIRKPNGEIYRNDDANWTWLANSAGKAARWLGYVDFERIIDNRNSDPVILRRARVTPEAWVSIGLDITIPDVDELEPYAGVTMPTVATSHNAATKAP
jgi:hypothetical protein